MAHPPGECAGVECMVDLGTQFCERCGRDRDSFASARNTYRDCPSCGAACCADCWNLVDEACLKCAPFRLTDRAARSRIVIVADPVPDTARVDPYADLRSDPGTPPAPDAWDASWSRARQRPKEAAPAGAPPATPAPDAWRAVLAQSSPVAPSRKGRRAGRAGLAATAAWAVVAALAVAVLGASPRASVPSPPEAVPSVVPSVVPSIVPSVVPSHVATPAPALPTATPRATGAPRATPQAQPANPGVTGPRITPRPTPRPVKPVVIAPPPAPPAPTPAPTPELSPETSAP